MFYVFFEFDNKLFPEEIPMNETGGFLVKNGVFLGLGTFDLFLIRSLNVSKINVTDRPYK